MASRDRLSEVFTTYIKYIILGFKVVFYWDQPFQPKTVLVYLVEVPIEHISNRFWLKRKWDWVYN